MLAFEFPDLLDRLKDKLGLSKEEGVLLFQDTKRFLYLCGTIPGRWGPPEKIDACWHEFILFTEEYAMFCQKYFRRFIHHHPRHVSDPPPNGSKIRRTIATINELFGPDISPNWSSKGVSAVQILRDQTTEVADATCGDSCGCSPCD